MHPSRSYQARAFLSCVWMQITLKQGSLTLLKSTLLVSIVIFFPRNKTGPNSTYSTNFFFKSYPPQGLPNLIFLVFIQSMRYSSSLANFARVYVVMNICDGSFFCWVFWASKRDLKRVL